MNGVHRELDRPDIFVTIFQPLLAYATRRREVLTTAVSRRQVSMDGGFMMLDFMVVLRDKYQAVGRFSLSY